MWILPLETSIDPKVWPATTDLSDNSGEGKLFCAVKPTLSAGHGWPPKISCIKGNCRCHSKREDFIPAGTTVQKPIIIERTAWAWNRWARCSGSSARFRGCFGRTRGSCWWGFTGWPVVVVTAPRTIAWTSLTLNSATLRAERDADALIRRWCITYTRAVHNYSSLVKSIQNQQQRSSEMTHYLEIAPMNEEKLLRRALYLMQVLFIGLVSLALKHFTIDLNDPR